MRKTIIFLVMSLVLTTSVFAAATIVLDDNEYSPGETSTAEMTITTNPEKLDPYNVTWYFPNGTVINDCSFLGTTPSAIDTPFFETCSIPSDIIINITDAYATLDVNPPGGSVANVTFNISTAAVAADEILITSHIVREDIIYPGQTQATSAIASWSNETVTVGQECRVIVLETDDSPVIDLPTDTTDSDGACHGNFLMSKSFQLDTDYRVRMSVFTDDGTISGASTQSFSFASEIIDINVTPMHEEIYRGENAQFNITLTYKPLYDQSGSIEYNFIGEDGFHSDLISISHLYKANTTESFLVAVPTDNTLELQNYSGRMEFKPDNGVDISYLFERVASGVKLRKAANITSMVLNESNVLVNDYYDLNITYEALDDFAVVLSSVEMQERDAQGNIVNAISLEDQDRKVNFEDGNHTLTLRIPIKQKLEAGDYYPPNYNTIRNGTYSLRTTFSLFGFDTFTGENQFIDEISFNTVNVTVVGTSENELFSLSERSTFALEDLVAQLIELVSATNNQTLFVNNTFSPTNEINITNNFNPINNFNLSQVFNQTFFNTFNVTNLHNVSVETLINQTINLSTVNNNVNNVTLSNVINTTVAVSLDNITVSSDNINYTSVLENLVAATNNNTPIDYTTLLTAMKSSIVSIGDIIEEQSDAINIKITAPTNWEPNSSVTVYAKITDFKGSIISNPDTILMKLLDDEGQEVFSESSPTAAGQGVYYVTYELPANVKTGDYTVLVFVNEGTESTSEVKEISIGDDFSKRTFNAFQRFSTRILELLNEWFGSAGDFFGTNS